MTIPLLPDRSAGPPDADPLTPGDVAPWFHGAVLGGNPEYSFGTVAGRWVVMLFHGSGGWPGSAAALAELAAHRALFDDVSACCFGVTIDQADIDEGRIAPSSGGVRWFVDQGGAVSRLYGAMAGEGARMCYRPYWLLLDPMLRVVESAAIADGAALLTSLARRLKEGREDMPAPVLVLPGVFDAATCRQLIDLYDRNGGEESGFMIERAGMTITANDHRHKRRSDQLIEDEALKRALGMRIRRILVPMIRRAFQFEVTRIERWLVACYDGEGEGGYFRPHRDNTTRGTAHRKFACTINLNAEDYTGGDLRFPEFGGRTYRAPTGGAVIFSCGLLHEALPVTRGRRYAFLPFLYDEAGAALRERNRTYVRGELADPGSTPVED